MVRNEKEQLSLFIEVADDELFIKVILECLGSGLL
jgi:hypothetical protein